MFAIVVFESADGKAEEAENCAAACCSALNKTKLWGRTITANYLAVRAPAPTPV